MPTAPCRTMLLALLVVASSPGPSQAQAAKSKKTPRRQANSAPAEDYFLFMAPPKESLRFNDEVASDQGVHFDEDLFPDREGTTRMEWTLIAETVPDAKRLLRETVVEPALKELGFTPVSGKEIREWAARFRGLGGLALTNQDSLLFRAKDSTSFQKAMEGVEVLGNREQGRLSAISSQLFVEIRPEGFRFNRGEAECMVKLSARVYGIANYQDSGTIGLFDPTAVRTTILVKQVRDALIAQRPKPVAYGKTPDSPSQALNASPEKSAILPEQNLAAGLSSRSPTVEELAARMKNITLRFPTNAQMETSTVIPLFVEGRKNEDCSQISIDLTGMGARIPQVTAFSPAFEMLVDRAIYFKEQAPVVIYLGKEAKLVSFRIYVIGTPKYGASTVDAKAVSPEVENVKTFRFSWPEAEKGFYAIYIPKTPKQGPMSGWDRSQNLFIFKL